MLSLPQTVELSFSHIRLIYFTAHFLLLSQPHGHLSQPLAENMIGRGKPVET